MPLESDVSDWPSTVSDFLPEGAAAAGVAVLMTVAVAVLLGETMAEVERTEGTMGVKKGRG